MPSFEKQPHSIKSVNRHGAFDAPAWAALMPHSIVALGTAGQPIERLWALQSAIAKGMHLAWAVGNLPLKLPFRAALRFFAFAESFSTNSL